MDNAQHLNISTLPAIQIGLSPCPNDVYAFDAWIHQKVPCTPIQPLFADVQQLNEWILNKQLPVSKVSLFTLGKVLDDYIMLPSGAAIGYGCGPKIVARHPLNLSDISKCTIAVPGLDTTAYLLLRILFGQPSHVIPCRYDEVLHLVATGKCDAGVIIHETRFTFKQQGFKEIADLGALFENRFNCPLPLGMIIALRSLGSHLHKTLTNSLYQSIAFAFQHPTDSRSYVLSKSIEKDPQVVHEHINLYVTEETLFLSSDGKRAIEILLEKAVDLDLIPSIRKPIIYEPASTPHYFCHT